jgi:hypothetical protein
MSLTPLIVLAKLAVATASLTAQTGESQGGSAQAHRCRPGGSEMNRYPHRVDGRSGRGNFRKHEMAPPAFTFF